jgi:uncharacterized protein with PQ loop repeat
MVQPDHTTENVLATIGAVMWTIQILPQIIKSHRSKSTHGLSTLLMLYVPLSRTLVTGCCLPKTRNSAGLL